MASVVHRLVNTVLACKLILFVSTRDLGVHVDGYIAVVGHTIVVGASKVKCEFLILNYFVNELLTFYV